MIKGAVYFSCYNISDKFIIECVFMCRIMLFFMFYICYVDYY